MTIWIFDLNLDCPGLARRPFSHTRSVGNKFVVKRLRVVNANPDPRSCAALDHAYTDKCLAREVRVFPLLTLGGVSSQHVDPVSRRLREEHYLVTIEQVPYEFRRGGNQMMRVGLSSSARESF